MPRPKTGPKLVIISGRRWKESRSYVRRTEHGKKFVRATPFTASDPRVLVHGLRTGLCEYHRARRPGPSDRDQNALRSVLIGYAKEHGPKVASAATLAGSIEPLTAFLVMTRWLISRKTRVTEYCT